MDLVQLSPLLVVLSKPKVSDLVGFIFDEDVCRFEVPMDDGMLMQVFVASDELLHDDEALGFW